ncbi:DUF6093 family protein [Streptomyces sp. CAU 1734]|uniref:DUF6093 family protein n=1 Tax=Streptomyces sp. CAU 1734 TaxID=3140360 RepID=UPI0032610FDB
MSALDSALTAGRAAARELMRDQLTITRPGAPVFDWASGTETPGAGVTLYPPAGTPGIARVKPETGDGREVEVAEDLMTLRRYTVSLPWDTPMPVRPVPGDLAVVTASEDPRMVGLRLWVTGVGYSSTATAWRISMEDRS